MLCSNTPAQVLLRKTLSSGLFLAIVILYTIMLLLQFVYAMLPQTIPDLTDTYRSLFGEEFLETLEETDMDDRILHAVSSFSVGDVIGKIPSVLICIGLWLLYVDAKGNHTQLIRPKGLTWIKVSLLMVMVVFCVVLGLLLLGCILLLTVFMPSLASAYPASGIEDFVTFFVVLFLLLFTGILVFIVVYHLKALKTVNAVKATMLTGEPNTKVSQFFIVMLYAESILTFCSTLTFLTTNPFRGMIGLCLAALTFMAGLALSGYKRKMNSIAISATIG